MGHFFSSNSWRAKLDVMAAVLGLNMGLFQKGEGREGQENTHKWFRNEEWSENKMATGEKNITRIYNQGFVQVCVRDNPMVFLNEFD